MTTRYRQLTKPHTKTVTLPENQSHLFRSTANSELRLSRGDMGQSLGSSAVKSLANKDTEQMRSELNTLEEQRLQLSTLSPKDGRLTSLMKENEMLKRQLSDFTKSPGDIDTKLDVEHLKSSIRNEISTFRYEAKMRAQQLPHFDSGPFLSLEAAISSLCANRDREVSTLLKKMADGESEAHQALMRENRELLTKNSELSGQILELRNEVSVERRIIEETEAKSQTVLKETEENQLRVISLERQEQDAVMSIAGMRRQICGIEENVVSLKQLFPVNFLTKLEQETNFCFLKSQKMLDERQGKVAELEAEVQELKQKLNQQKLDFEREILTISRESRVQIENQEIEQEILVEESKNTFEQLLEAQERAVKAESEITSIKHDLDETIQDNLSLKAEVKSETANCAELLKRLLASEEECDAKSRRLITEERDVSFQADLETRARGEVNEASKAIRALSEQIKYDLATRNVNFVYKITESVGKLLFEYQSLKTSHNLSKERFSIEIEEGNRRIEELEAEYAGELAEEQQRCRYLEESSKAQLKNNEKAAMLAEEERKGLIEEINYLKAECEANERVITSQSEQLGAEMSEIEALKANILKYAKISDDSKNETAGVTAQIALFMEQVRQTISQVHGTMQNTIGKIIETVEQSVEKANHITKEEINAANAQILHMQEELFTKDREIETIRIKQISRCQQLEEECEAQREQTEKAREKVFELEHEVDSAVQDAKSSVEAAEAVRHIKAAEKLQIMAENKDLENEITSLTHEIANVEADAKEIEEQRDIAEQEVKQQRGAMLTVKEKIRELFSDMIRCKEAISTLSQFGRAIDRVETEIETTASTAMAKTAEVAEIQINSLREEQEKTEVIVFETEQKLKETEDEAAELHKVIDRERTLMGERTSRLETDINGLTSALTQANELAASTAIATEKRQEDVNELKLALLQKDGIIAGLKSDNRASAEKLRTAERDVENIMNNIEAWKENVERNAHEQRAEIEVLSTRLARLE